MKKERIRSLTETFESHAVAFVPKSGQPLKTSKGSSAAWLWKTKSRFKAAAPSMAE